MRRLELIPAGWKRTAEIPQEVGENLADRRWLARQLGHVVAIVDRPLPEASTRMRDQRPSRPTIVTVVAPVNW